MNNMPPQVTLHHDGRNILVRDADFPHADATDTEYVRLDAVEAAVEAGYLVYLQATGVIDRHTLISAVLAELKGGE